MQRMRLVAVGVLALAPVGAAAENDRPVCFWDFDGSLDDAAGEVADTLAPREGQARYVEASEVPGTWGNAIALGVLPGVAGYLVAPLSKDVALGPC